MAEFDWEVGDDGFEGAPAREPVVRVDETPVAATRWPRKLLLLVPVAILALIALIALLLTQRINDASATQSSDVLAAYDLLYKAIARSDRDLHRSLISTLDSGWGRAQRDLFDAGLIFDRKSLGLTLQDNPPDNIDVQLSSSLRQAEVHAELTYRIDQGFGATREVRLQHTLQFELAGQRWRQMPPPDAFWGETLHETTPNINITYPQRDQALARRLVLELDRSVSDFCVRFTGHACPSNLFIELELGTHPLLLTAVAQPVAPLSYIVDFNQQAHFPLYISLPAPTLVGVPIDEAGYTVLYHGYALQIARQIALVLSLDDRGRLAPSLLQNTLNKALIDSGLRTWPPIASDTSQVAPPIPLPEQDLLVLCAGDLAQAGSILRYDPSSDRWSVPWPERAFTALFPGLAPGQIRVDEEVRVAGEAQQHLFILSEGELVEDPALELAAPPQSIVNSPDGSQALIDPNLPQGVNLVRRTREGQEITFGDGYSPFWIDDQTYGFVERFGRYVLFVSTQDDESRTLVDLDRLRVALSDELRSGPPIQMSIRDVWPSASDPNLLLIRLYASDVNPGPFGLYMIRGGYLIDYNRWSGAINRRLSYHNLLGDVTPSPDQHWLAAETQEQLGDATTLLVHDMRQNQTHTFSLSPTYTTHVHWSSNAQWLVVVSDGVISLITPEYDYQRNIVPERPGCAIAVWVDRDR